MKNINLLVSLLLIIVISSCASLDTISYTKAPNDPIEIKILPLEKNGLDNYKFESDMIDNNICEVYGAKYGYIIYKGSITTDYKGYYTSYIFNSLLVCVPIILGIPFFTTECKASVEYEIQNSKKETIAKFSSDGIGRAKCAMYYGYTEKNSVIAASYDAANMAHKEIRKQLTNEIVVEINKKLTEAGTIK